VEAPADLPAQIDEFRIVRPLGAGAMGEVFLAHDTILVARGSQRAQLRSVVEWFCLPPPARMLVFTLSVAEWFCLAPAARSCVFVFMFPS